MRKRVAAIAAAAFLVVGALGIGSASADFGITNFDMAFTDSGGAADMRAGSHPYAWTTSFDVNTVEKDGEKSPGKIEKVEVPDEEGRDVIFRFPPGLVGDPFAVPRCSTDEFLTSRCPNASALGTHKLTFGFGEPQAPGTEPIVPVYNMESPPGMAVRLGFNVVGVPVTVDAGIEQQPPYRAFAEVLNIPQAAYYYSTKEFVVWGNPASPVHDGERGLCRLIGGSCPAGISQKAFYTTPRACEGPLETDFKGRSWPKPDVWFETSTTTHNDAVPPEPEGMGACEKIGFQAGISSQATSERTDSPSGLAFELKIDDPGLGDPNGIANSDIKKTVVALPEGVTINPSQAVGLQACTPAQFAAEGASSPPGAGCPEASKIGSIEVESKLLEGEILKGSAYVAQQDDPATKTPGAENPFDSLIALYMTVKHPRYGIYVGLAGKVEPDPVTGQIVTTFGVEDAVDPAWRTLPQLPFSNFRVRLREGARSPLITPTTCGVFQTEARFTPWAHPEQTHTETASFAINRGVGGSPCPPAGAPFEPGFDAGTANNNAGDYSPFLMRLQRRDGDQDLTRFDATLPSGALAKLAGVSRCSDAQIAQIKTKTGKEELASPSCPANAKIGNVWGGAGAGSQLVYVPGSVYLAGPFDGAPLSVVGVVPAVAGPFDVGVVMTRQALNVDPVTGVASVDGEKSDPIPHILAGIPLRVRDIQVRVDRPDFTLNPTSCDPLATTSDIWGGGANVFSTADDSPVARSARFQAANCANLGFKPRINLQLFGGTTRAKYQAVRATVRPRPGDANIAGAIVKFPTSAFVAQEHLNNICTRVQWAAEACPKGSVYGHAEAITPLLDEPLRGVVRLRSSSNLLPDLVADLRGPEQLPIKVEVAIKTDAVKGALRSTVTSAPDAPVTMFRLRTFGGAKGLISNSRNICKDRNAAKVTFRGHNGKRVVQSVPVRNAKCAKRRAANRRAAQQRAAR